MEITQVEILEQKLNRAFKSAAFLHCIGLLILVFLFGFEPVGYKKIRLVLSILVFVVSVLIAKPYFYAEKQLKQCKTASPRSAIRKFHEHFLLLYFPYTFWGSCMGVFLF